MEVLFFPHLHIYELYLHQFLIHSRFHILSNLQLHNAQFALLNSFFYVHVHIHMNIHLKAKNFEYIEQEMHSVVDQCKSRNIISKVIFETCYLTLEDKKNLFQIVRNVRPDFVKTSTGFGSNGATVEDIALMVENVGDICKIKASGGIRTLDMVLQLIDMGVSRIGCSSSAQIVDEYRNSL